MPCALARAPRQMLPPPTTTAIWTPSSRTRLICSEIIFTTSRSTPKPDSPASASPLSFRTTRRYTGPFVLIVPPLSQNCFSPPRRFPFRTRANPRVAARIRRREKGRGCVRPGRTPSPSPSSLRLVLLAAAVLAALEASEPAHGDVFAQGRDLLLNQIPDLPIRVFDER